MKRAYVDLPLGQMHYRYCGKGEPLIMIHIASSYSDEYEEVGNLLADKFSVYAIDLFGMGFSTKPDHKPDIKEHAQTVVDFMKALNIEKANLYGALVGANICARVAVKYPEKVNKMILTQPVYLESYDEFLERGKLPIFNDLVLKEDGSHLLEVWKKANVPAYPVELLEWRVGALIMAGEFIENMHQSIFTDEDYNLLFPQIKAPTTVVAFGKHPLADMMKIAAKLIPNAKLDVYKDAYPFHAKACPQDVADMVCKYMA